jgi:hypothetical protein
MAEMLNFWKQQGEAGDTLDMRALLQRTVDADSDFEIDPDDALAAMLAKLAQWERSYNLTTYKNSLMVCNDR